MSRVVELARSLVIAFGTAVAAFTVTEAVGQAILICVLG